MSSKTNKPIVILAGWLGSQPKHLKRYEALYHHQQLINGFEVYTRIATPSMVVGAVLHGSSTTTMSMTSGPHIPQGWPVADFWRRRRSSSMQDLAWDVLAEIHHRQPPLVLFHVFSNGGCFLWEQVCRILDQASDFDSAVLDRMVIQDKQAVDALLRIRERVRGVVFDSCPGAELQRIGEAMQYCSWRERWQVWWMFGSDYFLLDQDETQRKLRARGDSYMNYLKTHPWQIPQLYLYSANDPLARVDAIDDLIHYRKQLVGKDRIWSRRWDYSLHCLHLRMHPDEYKDAVESFVAFCRTHSRL